MRVDLLKEGYCHKTSLGDINYNSYIRFILDTNIFTISFDTFFKEGFYPHVGITAQCGIAIHYRFIGEKIWYPVDLLRYWGEELKVDLSSFIPADVKYEIYIAGPIIGGFQSFYINLGDKNKIYDVEIDNSRNILMLGGPITFGLGLTSAGDSLLHMIERKYTCNVFQFSSEKNNFIKEIKTFLQRTHSKLGFFDYVIIELDQARQNQICAADIIEIINYFRNYHSRIIIWNCCPKKNNYNLQEIVDYYIDCSEVFGESFEDIYTLSRNYVNDSARYYIFKKIEKVIDYASYRNYK